MRKAPDYKLVFRTFEALMEFVSIYKIKEYEWEKYKEEYYLSFEPTKEVLEQLNICNVCCKLKDRKSVWDWKEEIKEMWEKYKEENKH